MNKVIESIALLWAISLNDLKLLNSRQTQFVIYSKCMCVYVWVCVCAVAYLREWSRSTGPPPEFFLLNTMFILKQNYIGFQAYILSTEMCWTPPRKMLKTQYRVCVCVVMVKRDEGYLWGGFDLRHIFS